MSDEQKRDGQMDDRADAALIHLHQSTAPKLGCFFFSIFLVVGIYLFYQLAIVPMWNVRSAKEWISTPCRIIVSRITYSRMTDSGDGNLELKYQYRFADTVFVCDQRNFMPFDGFDLRRLASKYKKGSDHICFVDSNNPRVAVLNRKTPDEIWVGFLFPAPFIALGGVGLLVVFVRGRKRRLAAGGTSQ